MLLNINDERFFELPDAATIRSEIEKLAPQHFIVLSRADQEYIQAFCNDDGTFQLEFRQGSEQQHFGTNTSKTFIDDVLRAFDAYINDADGWHDQWQWTRVDLSDDLIVEDDEGSDDLRESDDSEPSVGSDEDDSDLVCEDDDEDDDDEEVEFNGMWMSAGWPEKITKAQQITDVEIDGKFMKRVRFGEEKDYGGPNSSNCGDCGVLPMQLHVPGCDTEECPACGLQMISCDCECEMNIDD